jgi:hypothetical protein
MIFTFLICVKSRKKERDIKKESGQIERMLILIFYEWLFLSMILKKHQV